MNIPAGHVYHLGFCHDTSRFFLLLSQLNWTGCAALRPTENASYWTLVRIQILTDSCLGCKQGAIKVEHSLQLVCNCKQRVSSPGRSNTKV